MPSATNPAKLRKVTKDTKIEDILDILHTDGAVVIQGFLSLDVVNRLNADVEPGMKKMEPGSTHSDAYIADFHGSNTKRLTNLVTESEVFRKEILDDDLAHLVAEKLFRDESGSYWMNSAQIIEIGPGNKAQPLHRDLENNPPFVQLGPSGPNVAINFFIALTRFTEQNGATRIIPGSNLWPDYNNRGTSEMTIPAEMDVGDVLLMSGKVAHGGGSNQTVDERRRGLAWTFQPGYLTPEEAFPFLVDLELVRTMSIRAQEMIGFRSQYPKGSPGLWQSDYKDIATLLKL